MNFLLDGIWSFEKAVVSLSVLDATSPLQHRMFSATHQSRMSHSLVYNNGNLNLLLLLRNSTYCGFNFVWPQLCINQSQARTSPLGKPPGKFLRWSKALPRGKIFLQKHGPRGKETPTPGEYFRRSGQLFLLIGVEILGFCRNQTQKRIGRLSKYSLVIPSSFSLSTILEILKFSPSFETDLVTGEHQQLVDQFVAEKCLHAASTDNLVL